MIIDITEGTRMGLITSKKGSPILKVENVKFKREVEGRLVKDKMIGIDAPAVEKARTI